MLLHCIASFQVLQLNYVQVLAGTQSQLNSASSQTLISDGVVVNKGSDHVLDRGNSLQIIALGVGRQTLESQVNNLVLVVVSFNMFLKVVSNAVDVT